MRKPTVADRAAGSFGAGRHRAAAISTVSVDNFVENRRRNRAPPWDSADRHLIA